MSSYVGVREELARVGSPSASRLPRVELGISTLKLLFKGRVFMKPRLTLTQILLPLGPQLCASISVPRPLQIA